MLVQMQSGAGRLAGLESGEHNDKGIAPMMTAYGPGGQTVEDADSG
jgi:hypothetical protein